MKKQMNVFACNKKLVNQDPPPRPLSEKLKELTPKIKLNKEKVTNISIFILKAFFIVDGFIMTINWL